jgi:hypothetical protein
MAKKLAFKPFMPRLKFQFLSSAYAEEIKSHLYCHKTPLRRVISLPGAFYAYLWEETDSAGSRIDFIYQSAIGDGCSGYEVGDICLEREALVKAYQNIALSCVEAALHLHGAGECNFTFADFDVPRMKAVLAKFMTPVATEPVMNSTNEEE